jgi:myosin heavy subunit
LLSSISANTHELSSATQHEQRIEEKVLSTNPVLESFGNAKTARNNNSSRFGKWLEIIYEEPRIGDSNSKPVLLGARITQYLLEKSRVVIHSAEERNYHIFYQMCASGILGLQPAASYKFLRYSKNLKIPGVDDKKEFDDTYQSMIALGFTGKEIMSIVVYSH